MKYRIKNNIRDFMNRNSIFKSLYQKISQKRTQISMHVKDEDFAKKKYFENTGKKIDIDNPKTFNEKLWWLKLNNRDPLMTIVSDKYAVRKYVNERIETDILNPLVGVYETIDDVPFDELKNKVFIKTNKGSGENRIWNPENSDQKEIKKYFKSVMDNNYYYVSREWNYKDIEPKIIIEEFIEAENELGLIDYRFFCFNGKVEFIAVDIDTTDIDGSHFYGAKRNIYTPQFKFIPDMKIKREQFNENLIKKPKKLNEMLRIAEKLSEPFVFCRVDLYYIDDKIYFGEITFYPGGGTQIISPDQKELYYGEKIDLNSDKIQFK